MIASNMPLIASHDFEDFVALFGLEKFRQFMEPGISLSFPAGGQEGMGSLQQLELSISLHEKEPLALISLSGRVTEVHAAIKKPREESPFQLDLISVQEGDCVTDIICSHEVCERSVLKTMAGAVKNTVAALHHGSGPHAVMERELAREVNIAIQTLETILQHRHRLSGQGMEP